MNALLRRVFARRVGACRGFHVGTPSATFDLRKVELMPLEQRKLTFDSHAMVTELERSGFEKRQAELIVSALVTLNTANIDIVYKDMVTKSHQEIALQQIMAHLDSIRKDMVILEKSEFANLRSENTKMKRELEQLLNRLKEESAKVRAETKLDINLERSRITDMFTDQEKKLLEATSDFYHKKADLENDNIEINRKIDLQVASLKTVLESLKLETVRYLAGGRGRHPVLERRFCPLKCSRSALLHSDCLLLPRHRAGSLPVLEVTEQNQHRVRERSPPGP
uniref:Coiled-coil domain containing 90B n=1 Tax=Fundulus heteroclitus TaxID=8078 RepID=A0A3Q2NYY2_FUNHE